MSDQTVDARRIKKRELDRKAQRLARERQKSRITQLEAMVETLRRTESNTRTAEMMDQLRQIGQERDSLLQILKSLNAEIGRHVKRFETQSSNIVGGPDSNASSSSVSLEALGNQPLFPPEGVLLGTHGSATNPPINEAQDTWASELALGSEIAFSEAMGIEGNAICTTKELSTNIFAEFPLDIPVPLEEGEGEEEVIKPQPSTICDCSNSGTPRGVFNKWRAANSALSRRTKLNEMDVVVEDLTSEDTPVRVMLQGWDSVEREGRMTPFWRKLRQVDEACFRNCDRTERLASLRIMHQLLTFHGNPTSERHVSLPPWLWMRPSQAIAHSYAIDFFVWPAIRERFIFSQHQYCTNLFWDLFQNNFKILWPYDFRDTYLRNSETGKYQLSPLFETRIRDINAWTMSPDFFAQFPELYEDIPAYLGLNPVISAVREERDAGEFDGHDNGVLLRRFSN